MKSSNIQLLVFAVIMLLAGVLGLVATNLAFEANSITNILLSTFYAVEAGFGISLTAFMTRELIKEKKE